MRDANAKKERIPVVMKGEEEGCLLQLGEFALLNFCVGSPRVVWGIERKDSDLTRLLTRDWSVTQELRRTLGFFLIYKLCIP